MYAAKHAFKELLVRMKGRLLQRLTESQSTKIVLIAGHHGT